MIMENTTPNLTLDAMPTPSLTPVSYTHLMAEAYTHLRIARAARGAFQLPGCEEAYLLGANGPDPFFAYKILSKHKPVPLPEIGSRMHTERCGEFLTELLARSETPAQKSYALGLSLIHI